jgi:hypothetical protein
MPVAWHAAFSSSVIAREASAMSVSPAQNRLKPPPVPAMPTVTRTPGFVTWNSSAMASLMGATVLEPSTETEPARADGSPSPPVPPHPATSSVAARVSFERRMVIARASPTKRT